MVSMAGSTLPVFKGVSVIFAIASVGTGLRALLDPVGFAAAFGLPIVGSQGTAAKNAKMPASIGQGAHQSAKSYTSLMGARQLGTGLTILTFAYQKKWPDIAISLAIIGIVVAGTDGVFLSRAGNTSEARFHAIPGALISALALAILWGDAASK